MTHTDTIPIRLPGQTLLDAARIPLAIGVLVGGTAFATTGTPAGVAAVAAGLVLSAVALAAGRIIRRRRAWVNHEPSE